MKKQFILFLLSTCLPLMAQQHEASITVFANKGEQKISKHIYGHFAEHLGSCIYGGLWVGPDSKIPNIQGYRTDVLEALKKLNIPNLRWPGGCFADEYHWMDGIGDKSKRPKMVNNNWGGTVEDNSFGTHEFLNLCELLGCEPYVSANVGSGSVEEMAKWVEYITSENSPMAKLRRQNGRDKAWSVKYWGVGNESWGCGGSMRPEYYADLYRRYSTYCRNYDGNKLFKIASGASDYDYNWTDVLMNRVGTRMDGLSLHYYIGYWQGCKHVASEFNDEEYGWTMSKCIEIEEVIKKHIAIMDKYDKGKKVSLMVDEWGTWWQAEPNTNPRHLFQQNTMRDAMVAALTLNIFNKYADRIKMANIAQVVNVLQSMILTKGDKMVLTPTYYVFDMYKVHQDAIYLPLEIGCYQMATRGGRTVPTLSASASKDNNGDVHITLANIDLQNTQEVTLLLDDLSYKKIGGQILSSHAMSDHNTFDNPNVVKPMFFKDFKKKEKKVILKLPAKSIVLLTLEK